jgi:hypothetical protein
MAASTARLLAEAPLAGHGDAETSPKPEPSASNTTEAAAATNAPAMMAGQDTAEADASLLPAATAS